MGNKSKNKQRGLHQTERLLYRQNYEQTEKATYWIEDRVNIQNVQWTRTTQNQKKIQPN